MHKQYGNNLVLTPFPMDIPIFEIPEKRTQAVQMDFPIYLKDTIEYTLLDKEISQLPKNILITSAFNDSYSLSFEKEENKLIIYKSFISQPKRLKIDEYKEFYEFIANIKNFETNNTYIEIQ